MNRKPGLDPRTLALAIGIGALELAIVVLWLLPDSTVAAWFAR